jgi:hypothetical protein
MEGFLWFWILNYRYMRKLTKTYQNSTINMEEIESFEREESIIIPEIYKEFIVEYQGSGVNEILYYDKSNTLWILNAFSEYEDMTALYKELKSGYGRKLIPFAYDPGGWHFCLCLDDEYFGTIYINRWTDHLPEEQFLKIADSFEEFINGLHAEDE